jgi:signal transduction histidine kinase
MNNISGSAWAIGDNSNRAEGLTMARDASEDVDRLKTMFMAKMNHELRTPLNAIIGISSLLQLEDSLNPEQRDMVDIIRNSGEELLVLIENMLDFSRINAEKVKLNCQPFRLSDCMQPLLRMFSPAASAKGLHLACFMGEGIPAVVVGDARRLGQILINLLENAIKFTDHGEIAIFISSWPENMIHFAVKDTGIGIPFDRQDGLFQFFSQVDESLTRKYHGVGLGLATSRRLVELMGGQIWMESHEGSGSIFHFTISANRMTE